MEIDIIFANRISWLRRQTRDCRSIAFRVSGLCRAKHRESLIKASRRSCAFGVAGENTALYLILNKCSRTEASFRKPA